MNSFNNDKHCIQIVRKNDKPVEETGHFRFRNYTELKSNTWFWQWFKSKSLLVEKWLKGNQINNSDFYFTVVPPLSYLQLYSRQSTRNVQLNVNLPWMYSTLPDHGGNRLIYLSAWYPINFRFLSFGFQVSIQMIYIFLLSYCFISILCTVYRNYKILLIGLFVKSKAGSLNPTNWSYNLIIARPDSNLS